MKKFLIVSFVFLLLALVTAVTTFFYVSSQLTASQEKSDIDLSVEGADENIDTVGTYESIPLRDTPLTDTQQSLIEKAGVDVDTFEITPEMQSCAYKKLGKDRVNEIISGASPGPLETAQLLSCI